MFQVLEPLIIVEEMVMKVLKILAVILVAAFIVLQFFRIDRTNPVVVQPETLEATLAVPPDINAIIGRSCNDCHSNKTIYPWYSNVQPVAWYLKNDIDDGRRQMNFSIWKTYSSKKQSKKLDEICEQLEAKEMPLPSYLWIHRASVLSENDSKALCDWARMEKVKVDAAISTAAPSN